MEQFRLMAGHHYPISRGRDAQRIEPGMVGRRRGQGSRARIAAEVVPVATEKRGLCLVDFPKIGGKDRAEFSKRGRRFDAAVLTRSADATKSVHPQVSSHPHRYCEAR